MNMVVAEVSKNLGIADGVQVRAGLYKMLLYEEGAS